MAWSFFLFCDAIRESRVLYAGTPYPLADVVYADAVFVELSRLTMGQARSRLKGMQSEQPWCVYCGKTALGTSIDHMPPITMFDQRQRHKGLEFLACDGCHAGTRLLDQTAGFLCRLHVKGNFDVALKELLQAGAAIQNNFPALLEEWSPLGPEDTALFQEARRHLPGTRFARKSGPKTSMVLSRFAARAALALHYELCGNVVVETGGTVVRWYTNAEFVTSKVFPKDFVSLLGAPMTLRQGAKSLSDQFEYSSKASDDGLASVHMVIFRAAFSFHAVVDNDASRLVEVLGAEQSSVFRPGFLKTPLSL